MKLLRDMEDFAIALRRWYLRHKRDLPWRNTRDPYPIWLSEVILQQTRVNQGLPYYHQFLEEFPTVADLAAADPDRVLRLWQGLGYYSRARNLQTAAREIVNSYGGRFPETFQEIRTLKGVGDYTAAAISSFAFNLPFPVIDGNVYRFLSRLTGSSTPIDSSAGKKEFATLAHELLDRHDPATHNQAMMELGATVCLPNNPLCTECPFSAACIAFATKRISELPVKNKKKPVRNRYFHYFIFKNGNATYIRQRSAKDIWNGLFEFPLIETEQPGMEEVEQLLGHSKSKVKISKEYRHLLSHQKLHTFFYQLEPGKELLARFDSLQEVDAGDLSHFAFPQLLVKYIRDEGLERGFDHITE